MIAGRQICIDSTSRIGQSGGLHMIREQPHQMWVSSVKNSEANTSIVMGEMLKLAIGYGPSALRLAPCQGQDRRHGHAPRRGQ